MPNVQIVTDSFAHFTTPHFHHQYPMVTVVPNKITIGSKIYRETVDISVEEAQRLIAYEPHAPVVTVPTEADYIEVYNRLARNCDGIISIHVSREMYRSYDSAVLAARQFSGHCPITVVDSQTLCAAQGMLVKMAAKAIEHEKTFEDMVRLVRGAVDRIYSTYYVESVNYLLQNKIMSSSHTILSAFLNIKPVLGVEDGKLVVIEKVRTRGQAIDRLVEFAVEFADIEDVVILQHRAYMSEQTRAIQDRLAVEFPGQYFPYAMYGASLAALIGTDATGVVVLEKELEEMEDDF
jgi:fatty acid kinase fatty acid binding subunit